MSLGSVAAVCMLLGPAASAAMAKPVDNLAPEVVGVPAVGERIVCAAGSWSGSVSTFEYRWVRDGIPAGTGVAYFIGSADRGHSIWCIVTATGAEGSTEARSSNSLHVGGPEESPPVNTTPPVVSGTPALGQTLTCSNGEWNGKPEPTFTYQWLRDGIPIEGATAGSYLVAEADAGHRLSCRVTASNQSGSASALSSNSLAIPGIRPQNVVPPQVLGLEPSQVGEVLSCSAGGWKGSPAPTFTYQWVLDRGQAGEAAIHGATSSAFLVEAGDRLHTLSCVVTAQNSEGTGEAASSNAIRVAGTPPQELVAPSISGTAAVGQTLTCLEGAWGGVPAPSFTFLWLRNQGLPGEEAVGSAQTHAAVAEDAGKPLSCEVTASNSEGHATASSAPVVVPKQSGGSPPHNTETPTLAGSPVLGQTLSCSNGGWSGSPSPVLSFQWLREESPGVTVAIPAATSNQHTITEADEGHALSCRVTAINEEGVASATSNVLEIPGQPPANLEAPQVSGTPAVGRQLACLQGSWSGAPRPTLAYRWLRGGTPIAEATASVYVVTREDRGHVLACRVTATNVAGSAEAVSAGVEVPGGVPQNTVPPQLSGTPAVGQTLTCSPGTWDAAPPPSFGYQWLLNGVPIPGAVTSVFTVEEGDRGFVVSCRVTATNVLGSEAAFTSGVVIPGVKPESIEAPQVSGTGAVGQSLTCLHGTWSAAPPPVFSYQWFRDGAPIASATAAAYVAQLEDAGRRLSCRVTATNSEGRAERDSSNSLQIALGTTLGRIEASFPPAGPPAGPTTSELRSSIAAQLLRAARRVRLAALRRSPVFSFSFTPLTGGSLQVFWYHGSLAHGAGAGARPLLVGSGKRTFGGVGKGTVRLRLTEAGRRLVAHGSHLTITIRGVFRPAGHPVSWVSTFFVGG